MSPSVWLGLSAAVLATSTLSGMAGIAGGIALLAVMTAVLPVSLVVPLHGVIQLASNGTRIGLLLPSVRWPVIAWFAPSVAVGAGLATLVWSGEDLSWFRPGIGVFILLFIAWRRWAPRLRTLPVWTYGPVGLVTGFAGLFIGAVGPLVAPFFLRDDFDKEEVVATQAVCQAWTHFVKLPAFLALGFSYRSHLPLLAVLLVCAVLGNFIGTRFLNRLSEKGFTLFYEGVLACVAVYLMAGGKGA